MGGAPSMRAIETHPGPTPLCEWRGGGRAQLSDNPLHPIFIEWGKRTALVDARGHPASEVSLTHVRKRKIILEVLASGKEGSWDRLPLNDMAPVAPLLVRLLERRTWSADEVWQDHCLLRKFSQDLWTVHRWKRVAWRHCRRVGAPGKYAFHT